MTNKRILTFRQFINEDVDKFTEDMQKRHGISLSMSKTPQGYLHLNEISVPKDKRKQGIGTAAMKDITDYADRNNHRVTLNLNQRDPDWGTTSASRLSKFYKRHGFVSNKGKHKDFSISASMYREPKGNK